MKRSFLLGLAVVVTSMAAGSVAAAQSQNQSLGDYARTIKKTKNPPARANAPKTVYDNDNMPRTTTISVVGDADQPSSEEKEKKDAKDTKDADDQGKSKNADDAAKQDEKSGEKKDEAQLKAGQSAEERQKALDAWKEKLGAQQDKINLLSRELDVLQREHQLKAAEFYADTARRTQNPNGFNSDDVKFKQQIADKQKQLDDAKNKLSSMQDEARKTGAPNSITQ
jgi:hypothetical protein